MSDEYTIADRQAFYEQSAILVATYYETLMRCGIPEPLAIELAEDIHHRLWSGDRYYDMGGSNGGIIFTPD